MAFGREGCRVLVVEDEAMVSILIEDMLGELGHKVVATATRLENALDLARDSEVDLAILDINLGGKSSHSVADLLRNRRVPFIFASGYGVSALPGNHSGTPIVQKPFQIEELGDAIGLALSSQAEK
jgi:DNA-binding response OmpR family regulator